MNFIEVFNKNDKQKLIDMGYKLIRSTQVSDGEKYIFANIETNQLSFNEIKFNLTNQLHF